mmetsp:Transcript_22195/g.64456  ORF Transcript_22195/g.64456 Transcript_22195/m.64456 type:complete len:211 (-) Transcript_22195:307-939(-)
MSVEVRRVPFFLEPDYPEEEGFEESNEERLVRKWGGAREFQAQRVRHRLKERGQEVGIPEFVLDRRASSTMASHRVVQWVAQTLGTAKAEALYDRLNHLHFERGVKLNDKKMLARESAAVAGVDEDAARKFLASDQGKDEILRTVEHVHRLGIHGIPTFVIDGGNHVLSGAVHSSELVRVFREIEAEISQSPAPRPPPVFEDTLHFAVAS